MPPPRKLVPVPYDVTVIFTSIPVEDAIIVIKTKLEQNTKLHDRCKLFMNQIVTLLEFCLNTTYSVCGGIFSREISGVPVSQSMKMEDRREPVH